MNIYWTMLIIISSPWGVQVDTIGFTSKETCVQASKDVFNAYKEVYTSNPSTISVRCLIK